MTRPTDYKIVRANSCADLEQAVKLLMGEGWIPVGGGFIDNGFAVCQAMVRYG